MNEEQKQPRPFGSATPLIGNRALLDAEVERRKQARGEAAVAVIRPREPEPISDVIGRILAKHGLTAADAQAAEENREREDRRRMQQMERDRMERGWRYRCPERYREEFFPDLLPLDVSRRNVGRILDYEPVNGKGLYVLGESRRGKTRAVFAMLKRHYVNGRSVEWYDGVGFAIECSRVFAEAALTESWLRRMVRPDIVFIDDLAKRFTPATQQGFFAVLDRRTAARKPIVLTTNCTGESLAAMIGDEQLAEPMRWRLREFCDVVKL